MIPGPRHGPPGRAGGDDGPDGGGRLAPDEPVLQTLTSVASRLLGMPAADEPGPRRAG